MGESKAKVPSRRTVRKPAGDPAPRKTSATAKTTRQTKTAEIEQPAPAATRISPEERHQMIAECAYYRSLSSDGSTDPVRDWVEAEMEIDNHLLGQS